MFGLVSFPKNIPQISMVVWFLMKIVVIVEHGDGTVIFRDDVFDYMLDISSGDLSIPLNATQ